jgi:hypothetical protein
MTSQNSTDRQNERVLDRLRQGPVTSCELIRDLDIIRPSARIYDLRQYGHQIVTAWDWGRINGTDHRVGRYVLLPKEPDPGKAKGPDSAPHEIGAHKPKTSNQNSTSIVREAASFSLLAFIVTWALGSAVLGMAESSTPEVVLMTAGVVTDGR